MRETRGEQDGSRVMEEEDRKSWHGKRGRVLAAYNFDDKQRGGYLSLLASHPLTTDCEWCEPPPSPRRVIVLIQAPVPLAFPRSSSPSFSSLICTSLSRLFCLFLLRSRVVDVVSRPPSLPPSFGGATSGDKRSVSASRIMKRVSVRFSSRQPFSRRSVFASRAEGRCPRARPAPKI